MGAVALQLGEVGLTLGAVGLIFGVLLIVMGRAAQVSAACPMYLTGKANIGVKTPVGEALLIPRTSFAGVGLESPKLVISMGIFMPGLAVAIITAGITMSSV